MAIAKASRMVWTSGDGSWAILTFGAAPSALLSRVPTIPGRERCSFKKFYIPIFPELHSMVNYILVAIVVVAGFILLRMIFGGTTSPSSRRSVSDLGRKDFAKVSVLERQVESLDRFVRTSKNDKQREQAAKKMEKLLKEKERLKLKTEREIRKA
jgi:hypothetical protein